MCTLIGKRIGIDKLTLWILHPEVLWAEHLSREVGEALHKAVQSHFAWKDNILWSEVMYLHFYMYVIPGHSQN